MQRFVELVAQLGPRLGPRLGPPIGCRESFCHRHPIDSYNGFCVAATIPRACMLAWLHADVRNPTARKVVPSITAESIGRAGRSGYLGTSELWPLFSLGDTLSRRLNFVIYGQMLHALKCTLTCRSTSMEAPLQCASRMGGEVVPKWGLLAQNMDQPRPCSGEPLGPSYPWNFFERLPKSMAACQ